MSPLRSITQWARSPTGGTLITPRRGRCLKMSLEFSDLAPGNVVTSVPMFQFGCRVRDGQGASYATTTCQLIAVLSCRGRTNLNLQPGPASVGSCHLRSVHESGKKETKTVCKLYSHPSNWPKSSKCSISVLCKLQIKNRLDWLNSRRLHQFLFFVLFTLHKIEPPRALTAHTV